MRGRSTGRSAGARTAARARVSTSPSQSGNQQTISTEEKESTGEETGAAAVAGRQHGIDPARWPEPESTPANDVGIPSSIAFQRLLSRVSSLESELKEHKLQERRRTAQLAALERRQAALTSDNTALLGEKKSLAEAKTELEAGLATAGQRAQALSHRTDVLHGALLSVLTNFVEYSREFATAPDGIKQDPARLFAIALNYNIRHSDMLSSEERAHAELVHGLFDPLFYLEENKEELLGWRNPLLHYILHGYKKKRNPNRLFDTQFYLAQTGPLEIDPLLHYVREGAVRGLKTHPLMDGAYYLAANPDVAAAGINPLFHYQLFGGRERRNPCLLFDTAYYMEGQAHPDLISNPLEHYLRNWSENRREPHALFSGRYYLEQAGLGGSREAPLLIYVRRPELGEVYDPHPLLKWEHVRNQGFGRTADRQTSIEAFLQAGSGSAIEPHVVFDSALYHYQLEIERGIPLTEPALLHYLRIGYRDKTLVPNLLFDPRVYRSRNNYAGDEPELVHYLTNGCKHGAICHELFDTSFYDQGRDDTDSVTALEHALLNCRKGIRTDSRLKFPLDSRVFDFVDAVLFGDPQFDADFYRSFYTDLAELDNQAAFLHFEEFGRNEGRIGSARSLVVEAGLKLCDFPVTYSEDEYLALNLDLEGLRGNFLGGLAHYILHGRPEGRMWGSWQFHLDTAALNIPTTAKPHRIESSQDRMDVCVLGHIFYPDLWPELAGYIRNFSPVSHDVFINVVDIAWNAKFQRELRELCPGAFVQLSNDDGRDIGGFMRLLDNVDLGRYDFCALIHSKKSPHIPAQRATHWRRALLNAFAGSPDIARECVHMMHEDPKIGIVAAQEFRGFDMGKNDDQYEQLLNRFGVEGEARKLEYVSGTMFLIRSEIIERLHKGLNDVRWEPGGDNVLAFHMDGQIAHGAERLIPALARQMGFALAWR